MLSEKTTPARLIETASIKLPRYILFIVSVLYIFFGLFFRDPWKTDDITGLATMLSSLDGSTAHWFAPQIGSFAFAQEGPLNSWIGALFIQVLSPFFALFQDMGHAQITASRIPVILYFYISLYCVWYGTYMLGKRAETQPLALPFGGEPNAKDYGRLLADCAFLFVLSILGIVIRLHETSTIPLLITTQALTFYGTVLMLKKPFKGSIWVSIGIIGSILSRGLIGGLPVLLASLIILISNNYQLRHKLYYVGSLIVASLVFAWWWYYVSNQAAYWAQSWLFWNFTSFSSPSFSSAFESLRDILWFAWPAWPFAIIAVWNWRHWIDAPHIQIPMVFTLSAMLILFFLQDTFEPEYSLLALPTAILAAMSLPTLRRGPRNALSWFSIMIFSLAMIATWLGWISLNFGFPAQINHNITRLLTGFIPEISIASVITSLLICGLWIRLMHWEVKYKPSALWSSLLITCVGTTLSWVLLVILWMPSINYNRNYQTLSGELNYILNKYQISGNCLNSIDLGLGQRAAFKVFANINFSHNPSCPYVLIQTNRKALNNHLIHPEKWGQVLWQGNRLADLQEVFILVQKNND